MATRFVNVDRNTPMLLPPDLREWVPDDDKRRRIGAPETRTPSPTDC